MEINDDKISFYTELPYYTLTSLDYIQTGGEEGHIQTGRKQSYHTTRTLVHAVDRGGSAGQPVTSDQVTNLRHCLGCPHNT